ncbi:FadR/GntR family transcriptional regulator [Bacillus sp. Marseille-P3661]|uniref:FadR/GntR family transcriptional regulator n=1 Tax=Bacillus sp. Marseille-P3661 TaxID=1936234 RepID=UPI000C81A7BB|nr:FadR/GntR family transcriptional regulator [Bacillus sp. Marseille-P3661]
MLKRLSRTPLTEEVYETLKGMITSKKISVGDRLPTETQLVEELGVSRSTIREVLITLQAEGFIKIKRGIGAFVIDKAEFDRNKFLEWFESNEFKIQELIEVRMGIEPIAASLAAKRITEEEIKQLEDIHDEFKKLVNKEISEDIVEQDEAFHSAILKAARNQGLELIYSHFIPLLHEYRSKAFSPPANPKLAIEAHQNILDAIKNRDEEKAQRVMMNHITESENDIKGTAKNIHSSKGSSL